MTNNLRAFLAMIGVSEGTARLGSNGGYDVLVGGTLFDGYEDHPREVVNLSRRLKSTAAGRYQILERIWDYYSKRMGLTDFSPESQDLVAVRLIKECDALEDIDAGRIETAIKKCRRIWASFPGAGYGQHENKLAGLLEAYKAAGGVIKT